MTKHSKVLFLLAFGAVAAVASYAHAKTCFIVGNCGGGSNDKEQVGETKDCMQLGYRYVDRAARSGTNELRCYVSEGKEKFAGQSCGGYHEKCVCNENYYPFKVDSNNGLYHSDNKKYVISDNCRFNTSLYHVKVCNEKYKYTTGMENNISATGGSCQVNSNDVVKYDNYSCPGVKRKVGDNAGGFNITRGNNTSTDPRYTAVCYEAKACPNISSSYHEQAPATTSGWKTSETITGQKVGKHGETIYDATQTKLCYTWAKKACTDWTVDNTTLKSSVSCSEGYKSKSETVKSGDNDQTCYRCVEKGCSDYSDGNVSYQSSSTCSSDDYKAVEKTNIKLGSNTGTCYKCEPKGCSDYGYYSNVTAGYRVDPVSKNGLTCYEKNKCQAGDYVLKGGYCASSLSSITDAVETALNGKNSSKNKVLGVATKIEKEGLNTKIRIVASRDASSDDYAKDQGVAWDIAHEYKAFDGDATKNWSLMTSEDVDAILDNSTVKAKLGGQFKNARTNLFALLVDRVDGNNNKVCETETRKYAYADVYQCYWLLKHKDDAYVERAVMRNEDYNGIQEFSGIASSSNKFPRYLYGTHIYMRANEGYNGKKAYQNFIWYSSKVNQTNLSTCVGVGNSSRVTLEGMLFGRGSSCPSYVPLSYGIRFFEETPSNGLQQKPMNDTASGSRWPTGVQPWRIANMYGGECSDAESKAGACRADSGQKFYCRMRMYWHGTGYICPYEMYKNGSKEPAERCFSESLSGSSEYWYLLGWRDTSWNYVSRATFATGNTSIGGYTSDNTSNDYYKTGVQGCFVKPAVTLTIKDYQATEQVASAVTGNTLVNQNAEAYMSSLATYNNAAVNNENAYDDYLNGQLQIATDAASDDDADDITSLFNSYKGLFANQSRLTVNISRFENVQAQQPATQFQGIK